FHRTILLPLLSSSPFFFSFFSDHQSRRRPPPSPISPSLVPQQWRRWRPRAVAVPLSLSRLRRKKRLPPLQPSLLSVRRRRRRQRKPPPLSSLSLRLRWMKTDNTRRSSSPTRLFGFSVRGRRIVLP
ncbi:hypothetical protein LINGRAHAP2_LOCUS11009, partial [Linum grandiflorum]